VLTRCSQLHGRRNGELALDRTDDNGNRHIIRCFSSIGAFPINWKRFYWSNLQCGSGTLVTGWTRLPRRLLNPASRGSQFAGGSPKLLGQFWTTPWPCLIGQA